jgi:beta-glucosidase
LVDHLMPVETGKASPTVYFPQASDGTAISPDPYLSSTMSFLTVRGMQGSGLITCAKHYFLYEQEPVCTGPIDETGGRTDCVDVSSEVDDKTVKELYLPSFAETVRAGTGAIMWYDSFLL